MAKRFIETGIWQQDWYLRMTSEYKLFFFWIITNCDHAGIFKPNTETFNRMNGCNISLSEALTLFNFEKQRVRQLSNGRWLIEDFFTFQYGKNANPSNRVHSSIIKILQENEVNLTSIRGLIDLKDGVKDKDKDKDNYSSNKLINKYGKEFSNMVWSEEAKRKQREWYGEQD